MKVSPTSRRQCCLLQPEATHLVAYEFNSVIIMYPKFKSPLSQHFNFNSRDVLPKTSLFRQLRTCCHYLFRPLEPSLSTKLQAVYLSCDANSSMLHVGTTAAAFCCSPASYCVLLLSSAPVMLLLLAQCFGWGTCRVTCVHR